MNHSNKVPVCSYCKGSGSGYEFPLWPKCVDMSFGEICVACDEAMRDGVHADRIDPEHVDNLRRSLDDARNSKFCFDPEERGGKVGRNHPETSQLAATQVKSGSQKAQILLLLNSCSWATGYALSEEVLNGAGRSISPNQTCTRLQELREDGLVERVPDPITGEPVEQATTPGNTGHLHRLTARGKNVASILEDHQ